MSRKRLCKNTDLQALLVEGYNARYKTDLTAFFDVVVDCYIRTTSFARTAKVLGVDHHTMLRYVRNMGHTPQEMRDKYLSGRPPGPKAKRIVDLLNSQGHLLSVPEIAEKAGASVNYVWSIKSQYAA